MKLSNIGVIQRIEISSRQASKIQGTKNENDTLYVRIVLSFQSWWPKICIGICLLLNSCLELVDPILFYCYLKLNSRHFSHFCVQCAILSFQAAFFFILADQMRSHTKEDGLLNDNPSISFSQLVSRTESRSSDLLQPVFSVGRVYWDSTECVFSKFKNL